LCSAILPQDQEGEDPPSSCVLVSGADRREACCAPVRRPPFPHIQEVFLRKGGNLSRAARCWPAKRTLDRFHPFPTIQTEGKGAGGFRGLAPWRSMRQRLMRAFRRAAHHAISILPNVSTRLRPCAPKPLHSQPSRCSKPQQNRHASQIPAHSPLSELYAVQVNLGARKSRFRGWSLKALTTKGVEVLRQRAFTFYKSLCSWCSWCQRKAGTLWSSLQDFRQMTNSLAAPRPSSGGIL